MGCSRDDDASFERGPATVKLRPEFKTIRNVRVFHAGEREFWVECTNAQETSETTYWHRYSQHQTEARATEAATILVENCREAQKFKPKLVQTWRI